MSRTGFWFRTAAGTVWALLILGALRSEPLWYRIMGEQYAITHHWCGAWGCTASLPKLLAWQIPMALVAVPGVWLLIRSVPAVERHRLALGLLLILGTAGWVAAATIRSLTAGQIHSIADAGRRVVFESVAGSSVVIPLLLASVPCLMIWRSKPSHRDSQVGTIVPTVLSGRTGAPPGHTTE